LTTEFEDYCGNECARQLSATPASDLKQRLIDTWANISQNIIDKDVDQCRRWLRVCEKTKEHHFEHMLN